MYMNLLSEPVSLSLGKSGEMVENKTWVKWKLYSLHYVSVSHVSELVEIEDVL